MVEGKYFSIGLKFSNVLKHFCWRSKLLSLLGDIIFPTKLLKSSQLKLVFSDK